MRSSSALAVPTTKRRLTDERDVPESGGWQTNLPQPRSKHGSKSSSLVSGRARVSHHRGDVVHLLRRHKASSSTCHISLSP